MVKLVAVCRDDEDYPFENRQLPLNVDKNLTLVLQFDDPLQPGYKSNNAKSDLRTFIENYNILNVEEVKQACMMNGRDLTTFLSHMVPCVGCRRSVEQMFHQLADQGHPALDPLIVTSRGGMSIKRHVSSNPTALYKLFYHDVVHMHGLIKNILKSKKNKRCFIHSLEMQKPRLGRALAMSPNNGQACSNLSSLPPATSNIAPPITPYYGNGSWMDIWNDLSNECKEEVVILDCEGILDLMEEYLKRHRFCKDCKSKVARAFGILVDEIDPKKETGYCSALYVGLRFCGPKSKLALEREAEERASCDSAECEGCDHSSDECDHEAELPSGNTESEDDKNTVDKSTETSDEPLVQGNQSRHIHVCCETNYIAHLMTRAEAEISGGRRERHAKTIDVAQEEVLTCISLYLYERLHRLWQKVRAECQTWRVLFYVSVETMRQVFEIVIEEKVGMDKLEALCEELEEQDRKQEIKQEKKRQKKKRQKKRKEEAKKQEEAETIPPNSDASNKVPSCNNRDSPSLPATSVMCTNNRICRKGGRDDGNRSPGFQGSDLGYSSGYCESSVSSREGSEVTCSDGFCNHDEHECAEKENRAAFPHKINKGSSGEFGHKSCRPCQMSSAPPISSQSPAEGSCDECQSSQDTGRKCKKGKKVKSNIYNIGKPFSSQESGNFQSRLLEMLKEEPDKFTSRSQRDKQGVVNGDGNGSEGHDPDDEESDGDGLTAEEIAEFERDRNRIREERIVLREKIRKNFLHFCGKGDELSEGAKVANGNDGGSGHQSVTVVNGNQQRKGKPQNGTNHSNGKKVKSRK
uniref:gametogenetin-binding protein 2-like isoform X1 n=1 Tax=Styela clava TaxID=7725 RepID=UPI001939C8B9|nr:gametogenetin-binding protein 2-like isoform X1 [Styela clava]